MIFEYPGMRTARGLQNISRVHLANEQMPPDVGRRIMAQFLKLP